MKTLLNSLIFLSMGALFIWACLQVNEEIHKSQECKKKNFYYGQKVKSYNEFLNAKELEVINQKSQFVTVRVANDNLSPQFNIPCDQVEDIHYYKEESL